MIWFFSGLLVFALALFVLVVGKEFMKLEKRKSDANKAVANLVRELQKTR